MDRKEFLRRVLIIDLLAIATLLSIYLVVVLRGFLLDLLISTIFAIVLHPIVSFMVRHKIRRSIAVVVVVIVGLATLTELVYVFTKPLYSAAFTFAHQLPSLVAQAQSGKGQLGSLITRFHIESFVSTNVSKITSAAGNVTGTLLSATRTFLTGLTGVITIALLSVFILLEGPRVVHSTLGLLPKQNKELLYRILERSEKAVAGYVFGNLATSVIAGIVVGATLAILGVPFALLLSLWVAIVDLLPLVGGLLAGIPTVFIAFLHSPIAGVVTLIVFLTYQQIENHILNPVVMARTVKLNPLWILISVLVGTDLAGFTGALIGIPVAAMIQVTSQELWHRYSPSRDVRAPDEIDGDDQIPNVTEPQ
ncbi:MAG: AI-2E family transporter [Actinomycetota bacterium]|nr:AI-2E family transporter [Actinomycetota bacterium]